MVRAADDFDAIFEHLKRIREGRDQPPLETAEDKWKAGLPAPPAVPQPRADDYSGGDCG